MAVIAGARTFHQIRATVRAGFMPVMKVSWITSPLCLAFAQKFLPEQTWVPFFNIVSFIIGTYINAHTKKKRLAALRRKVQIHHLALHITANRRPSIMATVEAHQDVQRTFLGATIDLSEIVPYYMGKFEATQFSISSYIHDLAIRFFAPSCVPDPLKACEIVFSVFDVMRNQLRALVFRGAA